MTWWQRLWRRRRLEADLDRELDFHLDQYAATLIEHGHDPSEARRLARLALGGTEQVKESCRDARGTRWLEDLVQDCQYAIRTMLRRPGFTAVALSTLALGIGATTVMFSVVNGVLLRPFPYAEPDRLVGLDERTERERSPIWGNLWAFAYPNFLDCQRQSRSLTLAAWRYRGGTVSAPGEADYADGEQISSEMFSVLGVPLLRGRAFLPQEDRPGGPPVAIVSYGLWLRRFGGGERALGSHLVFDGRPYTVVGITPAGFRFLGDEIDIFTPIGQDTAPDMQDRRVHPRIRVLARLGPGIPLARARAELATIGRHLAEQYPDSNAGRTFVAQPLAPDVGDVRYTLWLLLAAVGVVLLIACVNVGGLLLARMVSRQHELAMRAALGANRGRLVRQCLTESAVSSLSGGLLGVLLAAAGLRPFVVFWPGSLPRAEEVQLDWRVLLFAVGVSVLSGLLFGLAPALRAPARALERRLRDGARTVAGGPWRLHSSFVVAEIALAVVLLVSAGILGTTLLRLSSVDPGLDVRNVLVARVALSPDVLANPAGIPVAWKELLDRVRRAPGVQSVAAVDTVPMRQGYNQLGYWTTAAVPPASEQPQALATSVTPDYLTVMDIALLQGRFFDDRDRIGTQPVVVIDEVLARHAFGARPPVGKRLWVPAIGAEPVVVAGVVRHVRHWGLAGDDQAEVRGQLYYPFAQVPERLLRRWSELMSVAVRTSLPPLNMVEPLRRAVRGAGNDQVIYEIRTMEQLVSDSLARQRFLLLLFGIFATLALLLASIGIYGVLSYVTRQRVPEYGVRMVLGASGATIMWTVLRQSLGMVCVGVAFGAAAAVAAGRLLEHTVPGVQSAQPLTFVVMNAVLAAAALFASLAPARRASRIDPIRTLRQE